MKKCGMFLFCLWLAAGVNFVYAETTADLTVNIESFMVSSRTLTLEGESFELKDNSKSEELSGASGGKALFFPGENNKAELECEFEKGLYNVTVFSRADVYANDAFRLFFNGSEKKLWQDGIKKIARCKTFSIGLPETKKYKIELFSAKTPVYIDRIEIEKVNIEQTLLTVTGKDETRKTLKINLMQNIEAVPFFEIFELTFSLDIQYANPFFDAGIAVRLTSPSGKQVNVGGFYFGPSDKPEILDKLEDGKEYPFSGKNYWKARYAPSEEGKWTYVYLFADKNGDRAEGNGSFTCIKGKNPLKGFMRISKENPFRWVLDDGSAFFPIGIQDCVPKKTEAEGVLAGWSMEGPFRENSKLILPEGAIFKRGRNCQVDAGVYFRNYSYAGFNVFRFSQNNCSFDQYSTLTHYYIKESVMTDELLGFVRKYGFHINYGFFGYQKVFNDTPEFKEAMALLKHFIKYSVDRWGAYVDIWQYLNEQTAEAGWYNTMSEYLRPLCPYKHPITTCWPRPELDSIDYNAHHWYVDSTISELEMDKIVADTKYKRFGKAVMLGEHGNILDLSKPRPAGFGGVWDPGSALRMRLRNWSFLFNEMSVIFWVTNGAKDAHYMNMWLGPKERQYVRAMQDFANLLDKDIKMSKVEVSDPEAARAYGLASGKKAAVYVHHYKTHSEPLKNLKITFDVPIKAKGYWYNPENAAVLGRFEAEQGRQTYTVPDFTIDMALLITNDGAPDIDKDGIPNDLDKDNDNDGVEDSKDAFPLDPEEWADTDGDGIGDNMEHRCQNIK